MKTVASEVDKMINAGQDVVPILKKRNILTLAGESDDGSFWMFYLFDDNSALLMSQHDTDEDKDTCLVLKDAGFWCREAHRKHVSLCEVADGKETQH